MRLTKIYTKVGDKGTTLLASGTKVPKNSPRIETYGTVDELNSYVGLLLDTIREHKPQRSEGYIEQLTKIQHRLFDLGSELATPSEALNPERQRIIVDTDVTWIENSIDAMNDHLQPLANFVLPGGHPCNSWAHVCRTVCRRAERLLVHLREVEPAVRAETQRYLNRLSDYFFVLSRALSQDVNAPEVLWDSNV